MENREIVLVQVSDDENDREDALNSLRLIKKRSTKKHCPICFSENTCPIVYGYPGGDLFEQAERGEVHLGGCCIIEGLPQPDRYCNECGFEWKQGEEDVNKLFEIRIEPTYGMTGEDGDESLALYRDGKIISRNYLFGEDDVPYRIQVEETEGDEVAKVTRIINENKKKIDQIPNVLNNYSCDGSFWVFTFGNKTIRSLNPCKIDIDELDVSRYSDDEILTLRHENTLIEIFEKIRSVLKDEDSEQEEYDYDM